MDIEMGAPEASPVLALGTVVVDGVDAPLHAPSLRDGDVFAAKSLVAFETLDRSSPELWPTEPAIAGAHVPLDRRISTPPPLEGRLREISEQDEDSIMREFGLLPSTEMLNRIKDLENLAYQLGLDEAYEMTKGKLLNVLGQGQPVPK
eukprot:Opistho-2@41669